MNPQQPQQPGQPLFNQPFSPPAQPPIVIQPGNGTGAPVSGPQSGSKLVIILGIVAALELLIIGGLLLAVLSKAPAPATKTSADTTSKAAAGVPATSASVQQVNDAISQDISGLNDDKDFPTTTLDDKSLGL